ncbi:hypothetical protein BCR41DRAFT_416379 [Lobosporangium transversale]|uniref:F-box domain-containing protein n=1 Tax=Lobosporangium transversale TaxID=64571 RepID=A0A1Y2G5N1_9FUNG|nr:hypothetical protein BCR41DRAFT_416379 [Lobosporangium transversale]ORY95977.1 hypothetical protein BCR41DRAFT_416379 [Lobosporangium transversale]|eukprot:XP_021875418.1 hypothetical protein BCR41DRAFT_416379 [Lobosporangium transversale]
MYSLKLDPLEIPEIVSLVGDFLSQADLVKCLRIPKTFYNALVSLVWKKVIISYSPCHAMKALKKHKETIELDSIQLDIRDDEVDLFFQLCKRLRCLDMEDTNLARLPLNFLDDDTDTFIFPNVTALRCEHVAISKAPYPHTPWYCLGMWIRRRPGLRSLDSEIKDKDMAAILRRMTALRRLHVSRCEVGPFTMRESLVGDQEAWDHGQEVRKLCDTIEALELNTQSAVPDRMQVFLERS